MQTRYYINENTREAREINLAKVKLRKETLQRIVKRNGRKEHKGKNKIARRIHNNAKKIE